MLKLMSFLKIEFGKRNEILEQLRKIPEVVKIVSVTGDYDMIVEFEMDETEQMAETFMKTMPNNSNLRNSLSPQNNLD